MTATVQKFGAIAVACLFVIPSGVALVGPVVAATSVGVSSTTVENATDSTGDITRGRSSKVNVEFDIDNLDGDGTDDTVYIEFPTSFTVDSVNNLAVFGPDGQPETDISIVDREGGTSNAVEIQFSNNGDGTYQFTTVGSIAVTPERANSNYGVEIDLQNTNGDDLTDTQIGTLDVTDSTAPNDPDSTSIQSGDGFLNDAEAGSVDVDVTFPSAPEPGTVSVQLSDTSANSVTGSAAANTDGTTTTVTVTGIDDGAGTDLTDGDVTAKAKITDTASNENPAGYTAQSGTVTLDTTTPTISSVTLANDGSGNLDLTFDADEQLGTATGDVGVSVDGPQSGTDWMVFDRDDFTESGSGPYTYTLATTAYSDGDGEYTATVDTARDEAGNDGGAGQASHVYDTVAPTIQSGSVSVDTENNYIDVPFSEGVSTDPGSTNGLTGSDLSISFVQNGGTVSNPTIAAVKATDGETQGAASSLSGGERTVRVFLNLDGRPAAGVETVELGPADGSSIYDLAGTAMDSGETTGQQTLTDQRAPTLDDASKVDSTTIDVTLTDDGQGLDVSEIDQGDFTLDAGTLSSIDTSSISDGATSGTVTLSLASPVDTNSVTVSLQAGAGGIADRNGNARTSGSGTATNMDGTAPTLDDVSKNTKQKIDVTLSDGVDVDEGTIEASDFSLSDGSISGVSTAESGGTTTVTITLSSAVDAQSVDVDIVGSIADTSGNTITSGSGTASGMDGVAPPAPPLDSVTATASGDIEISFSDVDDASGVTYTVLRAQSSGGTYDHEVKTGIADDSGPYTVTDGSGTDGTEYFYKVEATDGASPQHSTRSTDKSATADATAPSISVDKVTERGGDDTLTGGETVLVEATIDDATSGVADGTVELDASSLGRSSTLGYDTKSGSTYTWEFSVGTPTASDGSLSLAVSADDAVGNSNPDVTGDTVTLDTTGPDFSDVTVTEQGSDDIVTGGDTVEVTASVSDTTSSVDTVTVDASSLDSGSSSLTLTGSSPHATTFTVDSSPSAADGTVSLTVTATDDQGNTNTDSDSVVLDTTPPAAPDNVGATAVSGGNIEISFDDVDESGSGVTDYSIKRSTTAGGSYGEVATVTDDDSSTYSVTDSGTDGQTYYYVVTAIDKTGSESVLSSEVAATADATAPTVTSVDLSTDPLTDGTLSQTITVGFSEPMDTGTDPTITLTGLTSSYQPTGGTWTDTTTYEVTETLTDDDEDTTATIEVSSADDTVGNTMATETSETFGVDTLEPSVTTSYGGSVAAGTVDLTAQFQITDDDGGTTTYEYSTDGGSTWTTISTPGAWDTTTVSDGSVDLRVSDTDDVGNSDSVTVTVTVDNTAPNAPGGVSATAKAGGDVTISFDDVDEAGTGVTTYTIARSSTAGGPYSQVTTVSDDDSGTYTYTDSPPSPGDGTTFYYVVTASDDEDQTSPRSTEVSAVADADPPGINSVDVTNPTGQDLTVTVESTEKLASIQVDLTGAATATLTAFSESGSGPYTYTGTYTGGTDGEYTATLTTATDEVGNDGAASQSSSVTVDTTGPVFTSVDVAQQGGDDTVSAGDTVSVTADITDADSSVDDSTVTVDASPLGGSSSLSLSESGGTYSGTVTVSSPSASDGSVTLSLSATDTDGNENTGSDTVTLDTTAPAISGVSVTQQGGDGTVTTGETAVVSATVTDATSGVGAVSVDASPLGGSSTLTLDHDPGDPADVYDATVAVSSPPASDGDVTLDIDANDGQGNTGTATGTVRLDTTAPAVSDVSVTEQGGGEVVSGGDTVVLAANATDATSSVSTVTADVSPLGGSSSLSLTDGDGDDRYDETFTVSDSPPTSDGSVSISVDGTDTESLTATGTDTITVDTTPPADPSGTAVGSDPVDGDASVTVTFPSAPEQGTVTVKITDGSTSVTRSKQADTTSTTTTLSLDVSSLDDGQLTTTARIVDAGGNENPAGLTAASTVQKEPSAEGGGGGGGVGGRVIYVENDENDGDTEGNESDANSTESGANSTADGSTETETDGTVTTGSPGRASVVVESESPARANVTVTNADASRPVSAPVNTTDTNESVRLDELSLATREPNYTIRTQVTERPPETLAEPTTDGPSDTASSPPSTAGYFEIDHTVTDSRIDYVTFRFSIADSRLDARGVDPRNVSLYRRHDGEWTELSTVHLREHDGSHDFRADSPGLSVFAVGRGSETLVRVTDLALAGTPTPDTPVTFTATVTNDGTATVREPLSLRIDEQLWQTRLLGLDPGETRTVRFTHSFASVGTYTVTVGSQTSRVSVQNDSTVPARRPSPTTTQAPLTSVTATSTPAPATSPTPSENTDQWPAGVGPLGVLSVGVALLVLVWWQSAGRA